MNAKLLIAIVAIAAAGIYLVRAADSSASDSRLDKVIEQNDKILKNQDEILKQLGEVKEGLLQIRRRSS